MSINAPSVTYCVVGGFVLFSGIKGSSLSDTARAILSGDLSQLKGTEPIQFGSGGSNPGGGAGPAVAGSEIQNGTTIYSYLRSNGYTPIQAAGAIASIWGESTWNPESQGTGGRGLIGWTPPSRLPNSAFTGNAANDMSAQLPLILSFVSSNGDQGYVDMMKGASSVSQAAEIWGKRVERYGVTDVHTTGVDLAVQIAKKVDNVNLKA
jgi:hypothetical protein